jgi:hypothetical protein
MMTQTPHPTMAKVSFKPKVSKRGLAKGYRSGLEEKIAASLTLRHVPFEFEGSKIKYVKPVTNHTYTWDFKLPNGIIVESKGRFDTADRKKHLLIQDQHPDHDIRFVFSNPNSRISKTSKTTYAKWCETNGFKYAQKDIPQSWIEE